MKDILPEHNIELKVIDRVMCDGLAISASNVRKLIAKNNIKSIKKLVPQSTYEFILKNKNELIKKLNNNNS